VAALIVWSGAELGTGILGVPPRSRDDGVADPAGNDRRRR
jgi:hypothetical protein